LDIPAATRGCCSHGDAIEASGAEVTLQSATRDLIRAIEKSSPYLHEVSRSTQNLKVSGAAGHLVFVTPEKDADTYRNALQAMVTSMQISH
jgi:hypothetical protein